MARPAKKARPGHNGLFADLKPNAANFAPLTPISFLARTAAIHPERVAVVHGELRRSYGELRERVARLASALSRHVRPGETVSAMLPNVPAMLEAHFGVPLMGAPTNQGIFQLSASFYTPSSFTPVFSKICIK